MLVLFRYKRSSPWTSNSRSFDELVGSLRISVGRILREDKKSRPIFLPSLIQRLELRHQEPSLFAKFWFVCDNSSNSKVSTATKVAVISQSTATDNVRQMARFLNNNLSELHVMYNSKEKMMKMKPQQTLLKV